MKFFFWNTGNRVPGTVNKTKELRYSFIIIAYDYLGANIFYKIKLTLNAYFQSEQVRKKKTALTIEISSYIESSNLSHNILF